MDFCVACGRPLPAVGRFCTNCGLRIEDRPRPVADLPDTDLPEDPFDPFDLFGSDQDEEDGARLETGLAILGIVLAIALVAAVGSFLLVLANQRPGPPATAPASSTEASLTPDPDRTRAPPAPKDRRTQLRRRAEVNVPETARPSSLTDGTLVTYDGSHLLDGDPSTTWRMDGDGTGWTITFSFPGPVVLTRVGLVNGYAKADAGLDWYHGNRRVTEAEWLFDDGTSRTQRLTDTTTMQAVRLRPVRTRMVQLRLVAVTPPGTGATGRDYTAISDVTLVGVPEFDTGRF